MKILLFTFFTSLAFQASAVRSNASLKRVLLTKGALTELKDNYGSTPLFYTKYKEHSETVKLLKKL